MSTGVDLEQLGILKTVRAGLAPGATRIHASLDKLIIYARGGVRFECFVDSGLGWSIYGWGVALVASEVTRPPSSLVWVLLCVVVWV